MNTIEEAKKFIAEAAGSGCECPACGNYSKIYTRKLNSGMASILIQIYQMAGQSSVHVQDEFLKRKQIAIGREYSKLRWWGLLEPTAGSGNWRVTDLGVDFINGDADVPEHIKLLNNKLVGVSAETVNIEEALGTKFSLMELLVK